ncbi:MAG: FRG domain-containing protein [Candidatus Poribacteria bacterium]|nr:FRG domain-containing protein [Candidatus Poribacteria bacterium]
MNTQETELNRILEIIGRIAETTADGDFIYRGKPKHYEKVSSSLWRECRKEFKSEDFNVEIIQNKMLERSKDYTHEKDEFEILTELQHFGGYTNLIDFTTDNHIALFFACNGHGGESGRIVLLETTEEIKDYIKPPRNPQNRIIAQKSIFVRPPKGFIEPVQFVEVNIPESLKGPMLDHLQKQHGISTQTVYNDLHGFIRNKDTHLKECIDVYNRETQPVKDNLQVDSIKEM